MSSVRLWTKALWMVLLLYLSWLGMMAIHELGHVLGAVVTGGHVQRVVLPLMGFSRTDVDPNPNALVEVWAGPIFGWIAPMVLAIGARKSRLRRLAMFFAGVCGVTNGGYIGAGVFMPVGDSRMMRMLGTPVWVLGFFGVVALGSGLLAWHLLGGQKVKAAEHAPIDR